MAKVNESISVEVESESDPTKTYTVTLPRCTCKAFQYREGICKHIKTALGIKNGNGNQDTLTEALEKSLKLKPEEEFNP